MFKLLATVGSVLVSLGLATMVTTQPPPPYGQPPPKAKAKGKGDAKKKGEREPGGALRKSYDLLRRLRADETSVGRPDDRLRDWTDRAAGFYREGLRALNHGDAFLAREYGAAAHDLARAVDHARNAVRYDQPDPDLPPPFDDFGPEETRDRARMDLFRAYDRLGWLGTWQVVAGSDFYVKAARDLYGAARRDLEAGRNERAGELARAAEAMTHVPEHLARTGGAGRAVLRPALDPAPSGTLPKTKRSEPAPARGRDLPPALPPG